SVEFGMAFLSSKSLDLGDGEPIGPHFGQCLANVVEFERFDDGSDHLHGNGLVGKGDIISRTSYPLGSRSPCVMTPCYGGSFDECGPFRPALSNKRAGHDAAVQLCPLQRAGAGRRPGPDRLACRDTRQRRLAVPGTALYRPEPPGPL